MKLDELEAIYKQERKRCAEEHRIRIHRLVDMLREEASSAKVLELNIVAKVADLNTPSKSGTSSEV